MASVDSVSSIILLKSVAEEDSVVTGLGLGPVSVSGAGVEEIDFAITSITIKSVAITKVEVNYGGAAAFVVTELLMSLAFGAQSDWTHRLTVAALGLVAALSPMLGFRRRHSPWWEMHSVQSSCRHETCGRLPQSG